jgi:hypothetical protein
MVGIAVSSRVDEAGWFLFVAEDAGGWFRRCFELGFYCFKSGETT